MTAPSASHNYWKWKDKTNHNVPYIFLYLKRKKPIFKKHMKHEKRSIAQKVHNLQNNSCKSHPQSHTRHNMGSYFSKRNPQWYLETGNLGKLLWWPELTAGISSEFPTGSNPLLKVAQYKSPQTKEPAKHNWFWPRKADRLWNETKKIPTFPKCYNITKTKNTNRISLQRRNY